MATINRVKLTKRLIDGLKPVAKETWTMDSQARGLGIRQRPGVATVFAMRFKDKYGRDKKKVLWPVTGAGDLELARLQVGRLRGELFDGGIVDHKIADMRALTVDELVKRVSEHMEAQGKAHSYVRDFKQQCRDHVKPIIGDRIVGEVSVEDVDRLLRKVAGKKHLHNRVRSNLRRVFNLGIRWGCRTDNPVFGSAQQHEEPRTRLLTDAEMDRLLTAMADKPSPSGDAARLLFFTGSRPKELFGSRWRDFELGKGKTAVWTKPSQYVKQKRVQAVELSKEAAAVLRRIKDDQPKSAPDDFVFPSFGARGHLTTIKKYWDGVKATAKLVDARPYDLRKAFASRILAAGVDVKLAMSLTGHSQIAIFLKHYAHLMPNKQGEALAKVNWTKFPKTYG